MPSTPSVVGEAEPSDTEVVFVSLTPAQARGSFAKDVPTAPPKRRLKAHLRLADHACTVALQSHTGSLRLAELQEGQGRSLVSITARDGQNV